MKVVIRSSLVAVTAALVSACAETSASDELGGAAVGATEWEATAGTSLAHNETEASANVTTDEVTATEEAAGVENADEVIDEAPVAETELADAEVDDVHAVDADDSTIYAGIYSAEQARRGESVQEKECGTCHLPDDWSDGRLLMSFTGQSAYDFVEQIRTTMPMDSPGRLSYEQYTDIFAFILQMNGIPAGTDELPADEQKLTELRMEYRN